MSGRPPVSGAFEAYRRDRSGSPSTPTRRPAGAVRTRTAPARPPSGAPRTGTRPRRPSEPRRATPAAARRPAPGRREAVPEHAGRAAGPETVTGAVRRHPSQRRPSPGAARPTPPHVLRRRLAVIPVLAVVLFAAVAYKLVDVQVRSPEVFLAQGERQRVGTTTLAAGRGALLDRNGEALALSVPRQTVFADPSMIDDPSAMARRLAPVLHVPRHELVDLMDGDGEFSVLARTVPDAVAAEIEELDLAGIGMFQEYDRINPSDAMARSIIGRASDDGGNGISGLEEQLNDALTGTAGEVVFERSRAAGGGTITGTRRRIEPARPGSDVTLTLDQALQFESERVLAEHLDRAGAMGGTVIISRPSTGEVLALANMAEDDGDFVPTTDNVALTSVYEPGSVNKVITVAAAIEAGLVTPDSTRMVPDELQVGPKLFEDSHPHETTEWSVTDILATSSNVGTIMLAQELGSERMDAFLRRFGFGTTTGLGFPAESAGIMLPPEEWDRQTTAIGSIPIGQGVAVTALQMLQAFNVLGNDGTYVPARLVRGITGPDGEPQAVPSGEPRRVVSPETAQAVRAMMAQVVERGTGQLAAVPGYSIAGKTGTARKPQPGGDYEDEDGQMHYIATFAGLLPAENPDLSIIVVVDEPDPSRSIYAADVAAPAFADLARVALRRLGIPPAAGGDITDVPDMSDSAVAIEDAPVHGVPRREDEGSEPSASADGAVADQEDPVDTDEPDTTGAPEEPDDPVDGG